MKFLKNAFFIRERVGNPPDEELGEVTPADRTKGESPVMEVSMGLLETPSCSWRGECPS